ncbi:hypothetical protein ACF3N7_04840 [Cruoricaptor ignavus]
MGYLGCAELQVGYYQRRRKKDSISICGNDAKIKGGGFPNFGDI